MISLQLFIQVLVSSCTFNTIRPIIAETSAEKNLTGPSTIPDQAQYSTGNTGGPAPGLDQNHYRATSYVHGEGFCPLRDGDGQVDFSFG